MIYSNIEFIILLLIVFTLFITTNSRSARYFILLISSFIFYAWAGKLDFIVFLFVLFACYLFIYLADKFHKHRKLFLIFGILLLITHLLIWKYSSLVVSSIQLFFPQFNMGQEFLLPLPLGISFFTFQGIAYLIDYYRGEAELVSLKDFLLFKSFFPQLVAGPICRMSELKPQIEALKSPKKNDFFIGTSLFTLGFFKKLVIADGLMPITNFYYSAPYKFERTSVLIGALALFIQVWADFSGYTDMGRGAAKILGFHLPENFLSPMLSRKPSEYFKRWHASLNLWFRDYLFYPFIKSNPTTSKKFTASLITFTVAGLWHGANWFAVMYIALSPVILIEKIISKSIVGKTWKSVLPNWIRFLLEISGTFFLVLCFAAIGGKFNNLTSIPILVRSLYYQTGNLTLASSFQRIFLSLAFAIIVQSVLYYSFLSQTRPVVNYLKSKFYELNPQFQIILGLMGGVFVGAMFWITIIFRQFDSSFGFYYFQF